VDAELWVAVAVAAFGALPGTLAFFGKRIERREKRSRRGNRLVAGYDALADDQRAALEAERQENARLRKDNARLRAELDRRRRGGGSR
jgi:hypothetical protein